MKILILHSIPYGKIEYHRGIDHNNHEVIYLGEPKSLANIPDHLRCIKIQRDGGTLENCLDALNIAGQKDFDRIISLSEYELLLAAKLREALGVNGPKSEQVLLVRDKIRMKAAIQSAGLVVPRNKRASEVADLLRTIDFEALDQNSSENPAEIECSWHGKTVLKPTDGASSEGVQVYDSFTDALIALRRIPDSLHEQWEIEEFVDGKILHFDGMVVGGSLIALIPSQYIGTCLGFIRGTPLGSVQIPLESITEPMGVQTWVACCLKAVALENGPFHLESIATSDGLVFLEVGARVGGADVVECFERAADLHLPSAELALMSGGPLPQVKIPSNFYGWFVYPGHIPLLGDDIEFKIQNTGEFRNDPCVITWHEQSIRVPNGARVSYQRPDSPLAGVVGSASHTYIEEFLHSLFAKCNAVEVNPRDHQGPQERHSMPFLEKGTVCL